MSARRLIAAVLLVVAAGTAAHAEQPAPRIVTAGAAVTETVFALGEGASVVGADSTSLWPSQAASLPRIGYLRALGAEGILSLKPTLVLVTTEAGPPAVLEQIRSAGVRVEVLDAPASVAGAQELMRTIGGTLGRPSEGEQLAARVAEEARRARPDVGGQKPKVLFLVHAPTMSAPLAAGAGTPAAAMIDLAGGENVAASLQGYKPLTPEAAVAAAPDVIVVPAGSIERAGGIDAMLAAGSLGRTPAGRNRRVVEVEAFVVSFGPRTGEAIAQLASRLHDGAVAQEKSGSAR